MKKLTVKQGTGWQFYWTTPLPEGAEAIGVVDRGNGDRGVLIRLANGIYVQGNAGGIRSLEQTEVEKALLK